MNDYLNLGLSASMIFHIMVSFGFVIGIILMVSPEAFDSLNSALQKEYGLKTRLVPKLEDTTVDVVDRAARKFSVISGMMISLAAFFLLLVNK